MKGKGIYFLASVFMIFTFFSCSTQEEEVQTEQKSTAEFLELGDSITEHLQGVLLQNVAQAIQTGGTEYAVDFCNLNAIPLTDSISELYEVKIQRVTDRNRNPHNGLSTSVDQEAWGKMQDDMHSFIAEENGVTYFYKPIKIGMPTCIKCHGTESDISEATKVLLQEKYPEDKAVGYQMGELRGMWKVEM